MIVRAAMTETRNAYAAMPASVDQLAILADHLEDVRRANVDHHIALLEEAARRGARVVGFGELFTAPYFALRRDAWWRDLAEDAALGPTSRALREAARRLSVVVVAPIYERDGDRLFNTALVIDADGELLGSFRKLHIPEGQNELGMFCETFYYASGDGGMRQHPTRVRGVNRHLPVFDTAAGRIGVAICYDRHFEGVMSGLAAGGAQLVLTPAVTFGSHSRRMWDLEFAVDAARHRLYIGGSNRRGFEPPYDRDYFGASHFVGPTGVIENLSDHAELVIADLDYDAVADAGSSGWDLQRDARPEILSREP